MKLDRPARWFIAGIVLTLLCLAAIPLSWKWHHFKLQRQARPMIQALERHRQQHGTYPEDSATVGFPIKDESGPHYYQRQHPTEYIIWYGTTLGEGVTYDSTDGQWH